MKTRSVIVLLILVVIFLRTANSQTDSLFVSGSIAITSDTTFAYVEVDSGGVLTTDSLLTVTGNMLVKSNGKVQHSSYPTNSGSGLNLHVLGTLQIDAGGAIDVDGRGLRGGYVWALNSRGETYDTSGNVELGTDDAGGASYGGQGAKSTRGGSTVNSPYGKLEDPKQFGSGGGSTFYYQTGAGNGGGLVTIIAGNCILNGTIRGNGTTGFQTGGGSGGGIKMTVGSLGGSGTIEAIGGDAGDNGSGGGGRIAIYYSTMTLVRDSIKAHAGLGSHAGSAGTIYLKDSTQSYGDLILDNGGVATKTYTPLRTNLTRFQNLSISRNGTLNPTSNDITSFTIEQPVPLNFGSELRLGAGVTMADSNSSGFDIVVQSGAALTLDSGSVLSANAVQINGAIFNTSVEVPFSVITDLELSGNGTINIRKYGTLMLGDFTTTNIQSGTVNTLTGGNLTITSNAAVIGSGVTLVKDGTFGVSDSINSLVIQTGGKVQHSYYPTNSRSGLNLHVLGTLQIDSGGVIDVDGRGLRGGYVWALNSRGETYDTSGNIVLGTDDAGGASYGGQGAKSTRGGSTVNSPYGKLEDPTQFGSGGGSTFYYQTGAGNGGGLVTIIAGNCILNGTIRGNGTTGFQTGGGSGGGIKMTVGSLGGSGTIKAVGGDAGDNGSGGGGRIAIYYTTMTLVRDSIKAHAGLGSHAGSAGTIYLKDSTQSYGDLIIDNGGIISNLNTPLNTMLTRLQDMFLRNSGALNIDMKVEIENDLSVTTGGRLGRK